MWTEPYLQHVNNMFDVFVNASPMLIATCGVHEKIVEHDISTKKGGVKILSDNEHALSNENLTQIQVARPSSGYE